MAASTIFLLPCASFPLIPRIWSPCRVSISISVTTVSWRVAFPVPFAVTSIVARSTIFVPAVVPGTTFSVLVAITFPITVTVTIAVAFSFSFSVMISVSFLFPVAVAVTVTITIPFLITVSFTRVPVALFLDLAVGLLALATSRRCTILGNLAQTFLPTDYERNVTKK
jgi:hypothetical protein